MERKQLARVALLLASTVPVSVARSQPPTQIGYGTVKRFFNLTDLVEDVLGVSSYDDLRDVAYVDGLLYVVGNQRFGDGAPRVLVLQPAPPTLLGWFPVRDLRQPVFAIDSDLDGNLIIAAEEGVAVYDTSGNRQSTVRGDNGPVTLPVPASEPSLSWPSGHAVGGAYFNGMAFDPSGDAGNGSIFAGSDGPGVFAPMRIVETRIRDGEAVQAPETPGFMGLVIDPYTGNLWASQPSYSGDRIAELDPDDAMLATGNSIPFHIPLTYPRAGGLGLVPGGDPGAPWTAALDLVALSPLPETWIVFHRLHQIPGVPGYAESFLAASTGSDPIERSAMIPFTGGDTLNWAVVSNGRGNLGAPQIYVINTGQDAVANGITDATRFGWEGILPELLALSPYSVPASTAGLLHPGIVGDPYAPFPIGVTTVTLGPTFPVAPGDVIRIQSVYFDVNASLFFPVAASNEIRFIAY